MALKVETENKQAGARVIPGKRLWKTKDGKRLVEDGDPEAYSLYCTSEGAVPKAEYEKLSKAKRSTKAAAAASEEEAPAPKRGAKK